MLCQGKECTRQALPGGVKKGAGKTLLKFAERTQKISKKTIQGAFAGLQETDHGLSSNDCQPDVGQGHGPVGTLRESFNDTGRPKNRSSIHRAQDRFLGRPVSLKDSLS